MQSASSELPILQKPNARRISRRQMATVLLSGLAAGLLPDAISPLHPIHKHLLNGVLLDSAENALASGNYKPVFLSPAQLAALDKIAETIIPGSNKAQSAEFIDLLLGVDLPKHQEEFVSSLSALEISADELFHKSVARLDAKELHQLLEAASGKDARNYPHFENLKEWAIGAYYSSEIGMRELGWTPDRVFPTYPTCSHAESYT